MNNLPWGSCTLIFLLCFVLQNHAQPVPDPGSVLQQMHDASGGHAWDRIAGAELNGEYNLGGLKGTFRQVVDFRNGRDVLSYDVGATRGQQANLRHHGWWTDEKGLPTIQEGPEAKADAATQSYEDRNGWFHSDATVPMSYLGTKKEDNDRTFDLVRVQPPGGRELTLWIDNATHRLDRAVGRNAEARDNTTYFSDYRQVEGTWLPFKQRQSSGDTENHVIMTVSRVHLMSHVNDADFAPPTSVIRDAHLQQSATATTVPFTLRDGALVVDVSIDGRAPLPFVLDSGGLNLLTPEAAKKLGVELQGNVAGSGVGTSSFTAHFAQVKRYQVGLAELLDQEFLVIPLPTVVTNRGNQEPLAGLIGYEVLRRFLVTIDYHQRRLTLAMPLREATGEKLPLFFNTRTPFVKASIDGVEGYFGVDTGDDGAITLFKNFYDFHKFPIELPGVKSIEAGVGGETSTILTRVASLSLGHFMLSRPLAELNFANAGAFASKLTAGNLGSEVLQNFVITFDYEHRALYLEKSPDFGYSMPYNRSGLRVDLNDAGAVVIKTVNVGSPADLSGLKPGDQLLAVNHNSMSSKDLIDVEDQFKQPAGTRLDLVILRDGVRKEAVVALVELLPSDVPFQYTSDPSEH
jgi:PDZ domain/Aspartyl protease